MRIFGSLGLRSDSCPLTYFLAFILLVCLILRAEFRPLFPCCGCRLVTFFRILLEIAGALLFFVCRFPVHGCKHRFSFDRNCGRLLYVVRVNLVDIEVVVLILEAEAFH